MHALLGRAECEVDEMRREVNVAIRFSSSIDAFGPCGLKVRAVAGNIATASISLEEIIPMPPVLLRSFLLDYQDLWSSITTVSLCCIFTVLKTMICTPSESLLWDLSQW
jgi:hypothetical protein